MSITRSQIARELMAEGGAPRQGYFLGKIVKKFKEDIIPNELKSPAGLAAAALAVDQFGIPIGGGKKIGGGKNVSGFLGNIFRGIGGPKVSEEMSEVSIDPTKRSNDKSLLSRIGSGIGSVGSFLADNPELASIGAGLVAGAFSKKEDDPLYTGQSVGLNLRDIRKLANISDQKTGAAIGLNFLPDTKFRKFSPTEMAATYAANQPVDFTEQRESAEEGGIMEQFKMASAPDPADERNQILESMSEKYYKKPLKDLTPDEFMDLEEALGDMGMKPMPKGGIATMADGGMMNMGGMEMDLRGGGFVPIGAKEKADDVPARLSKNEFVFTADAVRAAGGGSVDKGADKMYATMKALENKVA